MKSEYNRYVQESEELENEILDYEDWCESQGYRGEYADNEY